MNFVKKCAFTVSLLALSVGLTASQSNAQSLRGTFTLPFEAYWGTALLTPGQYTLSLPTEERMYPIMSVSGRGETIRVLVGTSGEVRESQRSFIRVDTIGGTHVIREFSSGPTGKLLTFPVPKSVKKQFTLARRVQNTSIAVASAGGN
jgi:hypothetical protein